MDVFAHILWTNAALKATDTTQNKIQALAISFSVLPDIVVFAPLTTYLLFRPKHFDMRTFKDTRVWQYRYAVWAYNYTHSIPIALAAIAIAYFTVGPWAALGLCAWLGHILIDIFTHKDFFETPFLFPLSNYRFKHGIPWSNTVFMICNYGLLIVLYIYLYVFQ